MPTVEIVSITTNTDETQAYLTVRCTKGGAVKERTDTVMASDQAYYDMLAAHIGGQLEAEIDAEG